MVSAIITDTIFLTCSHKCFLSLPINMFYFRSSQSHLYNIFIHPKHSENIKVAQAVLYYSAVHAAGRIRVDAAIFRGEIHEYTDSQ